MSVIADIEEKALSLSDEERAKLADKLYASLPADFINEHEVAELLRRSSEMDENPDSVLTHEEFFSSIREHAKT